MIHDKQKSKLLITGFDAFGRLKSNPSAELLPAIVRAYTGQAHLETSVLPTSYRRSWAVLSELLTTLTPQAVLLLGYSYRSRGLRIERCAHNTVQSQRGDNDQERRVGPVTVDGPKRLCTPLPVDAWTDRLRSGGAVVDGSSDAGAFVCNYVYYRLLHSESTTPSVLVHVPKWRQLPQPTTVVDALVSLIDLLAHP